MPLKSFGHDINVLVIGASGAIGSAFVGHLSSDPSVSSVLALSRTPVVVGSRKVTTAKIDLTDPASIASAIERAKSFAPLDLVLVASGLLHAGDVQPEKSLQQLQYPAMSALFATNTIGPSVIMAGLLPLMRRDQKSVFAVISARVGSISDNRLGGWVSYRASKAALNMVIKTFSIELARKNPNSILVALQPGTVDSPLSAPFNSRVPAEKLFSPESAAANLLAVLDRLEPGDTGGFFDWTGTNVPY
jgi:NAD(P)-dependent dehydrogenase (short-subunit alcohol dehydrogenase family)